jgi:NADH dehydrogenase (ubiquinone) 1 alpha subcomplex subunit 10
MDSSLSLSLSSLHLPQPGTFALPMQLWLLRQRFLTYCLALRLASRPGSKAKGVIMDRSIFSDIVFALKNREDENIDAAGYAEYEALRAGLLALIPLPHAVVYLDVTAEACHDRVLSMRQRECESGIPLAYLEGLDRCYKKFCVDMQDSGVDVLSFDWEQFGDVT